MGLLDKLQGLFGGSKRIDVEMRFERIRSAVSGTMSNFFVAKDRDHGNRIVGVKLCDIEKVEFFESRFKGLKKPSEGEIAIAMKHPNVVITYEYGLTNKGQPYLVMEFVDGPGLQVLVNNREEELLRPHRLKMIRQMADALAYVHRMGYIHRDICPRNFIASEDFSLVKLIDFGLTLPATKEFMQPGNRTGTPLYMAPEVVRRRQTDQRVDIFSFGVTCYHLLTFELPWPFSEASGMAALHHDTSPPADIFKYRPDLHPNLAATVMQAMDPNPAKRIQDMETFIKQLRSVTSESK
ncbi:MAG: serine/threonine-protein kinase [Pirellulales bacterium]